jgi:hypothetical protein
MPHNDLFFRFKTDILYPGGKWRINFFAENKKVLTTKIRTPLHHTQYYSTHCGLIRQVQNAVIKSNAI